MRYKYLNHTSEAKFKAFGKNIDEVFKNSALAMMNLLGDTKKVEPKISKKILIRSKEITSLLYDFLSELIYLLEVEGLFLHDVRKIKITKKIELTAVVIGDNLRNYELKGDIKAVTYNDMKVEKTKKGYEATVVVDV